jgi:predicted DNA binding CopG/RHH family protein
LEDEETDMKKPTFKTEAEEADWYDRNRAKIKWGKPLRDKTGKPLTPAEIAAAHLAKQTRPVTLRLAVADIELAKTQAEQKGLGYQTYLKSLIHQAVQQALDTTPKTRQTGRPHDRVSD